MLDRFRRGRRQLHRHRRHVLRRRLGGDARAVAGGPPRRGRAGHEVPLRGLRPGRRGARARPDREGLRRQPAAARRRRDRPLPGPRARSRRAARGLARGARRARARRQGARARRVELPGLAARLGGRAAGPRGLVAVRLAPAAVLAGRALDRARAPAVLPRRGPRRDPVGPARRRLPDRALPARRAPAGGQPDRGREGRLRGGLRAPRDRAQLRGRRRGGGDRGGARRHDRAGRARVAARHGRRHRADRRPAHVRRSSRTCSAPTGCAWSPRSARGSRRPRRRRRPTPSAC